MTPEEQFEQHARWLVDHDRAIAEIQEIQRETTQIQRRQAAVMLDVARKHAELGERVDAVIAVVERFLSRGDKGT